MGDLTRIDQKWCSRADVDVQILHTERHTCQAIGNKQYKLAGNLAEWRRRGVEKVLTFGGAWSNHLHAFALMGKLTGLQTVGVVRGEEQVENSLLQSARMAGMQLHFVSRGEYRRRNETGYCQELCGQLECDTWLPEGGSNTTAVNGCKEITALLQHDACQNSVSVFALPVGTGATLAGVACGLRDNQRAIGFPVVKDASVTDRVARWVAMNSSDTHTCRWSMWRESVMPSYGKVNRQLLDFILAFFDDTGVVLDPVYTAKVMRVVLSEQFLQTLPANSRVIFVHTGGLIGAYGYKRQFEQCTDRQLVTRYLSTVQQLTGLEIS